MSPRSHSASQSPLLFHIHHPSGRREDNAIRLAPAEYVPIAPGAESVLSYLEPSNFESIDDLLCTEDEVYEMIASLDTSKANGSDGISASMLKGTAHSITPVLTRLFNMSIESGIFPDKWKLSSVVPIPKGGDHSNPSNYRPISLLSVISKIFEHASCLLLDHRALVLSSSPCQHSMGIPIRKKHCVCTINNYTCLVCEIRSRQRSLLSDF